MLLVSFNFLIWQVFFAPFYFPVSYLKECIYSIKKRDVKFSTRYVERHHLSMESIGKGILSVKNGKCRVKGLVLGVEPDPHTKLS